MSKQKRVSLKPSISLLIKIYEAFTDISTKIRYTRRMRTLPLLLITLLLSIALHAAENDLKAWKLGKTQASVAHVNTKDPTGELEQKTAYIAEKDLVMLNQVDGKEIKCPMYCVIKFSKAGKFKLKITCRADGNHQILAFAPRSPNFKTQDFRNVKEAKTITLNFDSTNSRYLVLNCTAGNLFVDALSIEAED